MGVFDRGPRSRAMILEDNDQFVPGIFPQGQISFPVSQQDLCYLFVIQKSDAQVMLWGFNDYFMLPDSIHLAEKPFFIAGEASLRTKGRKLVGNYTCTPTS